VEEPTVAWERSSGERPVMVPVLGTYMPARWNVWAMGNENLKLLTGIVAAGDPLRFPAPAVVAADTPIRCPLE
jgi:hypothetical protein